MRGKSEHCVDCNRDAAPPPDAVAQRRAAQEVRLKLKRLMVEEDEGA